MQARQKLTLDLFGEKTFVWQWVSRFPTVRSHFWRKFRKSNILTKELISRKNFSVKRNSRFPHNMTQHSVVCSLRKFWNLTAIFFSQKFRQIKVLLKNVTVNWFDGKHFAWQWISLFSTLVYVQISGIYSHYFLSNISWK